MKVVSENQNGAIFGPISNSFDSATGAMTRSTTEKSQNQGNTSGWESNELLVGSIILAYGLIVICISAWLINRGKDTEEVLRLVAVLSAVVVASFLLVVGYDNQQMNPVIGLLGTIVGYLLGKEQGVRVGAREESARRTGSS